MTVTASTVETLTEQAESVLDAAETALAGTVGGIPDLSYISTSPPAYDCCPALIVHVARLSEEFTSPSVPSPASMLRPEITGLILATYQIVVLRCAASLTANGLPSPSAIQAVSAEVQQDAWALWNGITHAYKDGLIFDNCLGFHRDDLVPVREQGGCVGWEWTLRAVINGIPNT